LSPFEQIEILIRRSLAAARASGPRGAGSGEQSMTAAKSNPLAAITPSLAKITFGQLMDARRPLLLLRMPWMLRGDRERRGSFDDTDPSPMSARRWNAALQKSRRFRIQRRMAGRAR